MYFNRSTSYFRPNSTTFGTAHSLVRQVRNRPPSFTYWAPPPCALVPQPTYRAQLPWYTVPPAHCSTVRTELSAELPNAPCNRRPVRFRGQRKPVASSKVSQQRLIKKRRGLLIQSKPSLNPSDPLNLQDLMKETERRRIEGRSPLRGDSRLNTPALSVSEERYGSSPIVGSALTDNLNNLVDSSKNSSKFAIHRRLFPARGGRFSNRGLQRTRRGGRRHYQRIPVTGNYFNYYSRRNSSDRLSYLMPEWFTNKEVADYGCHNGTFTFSILERFPDIHKIDAIDCDAELIANAKSMQRERIRWQTNNEVKYDKINFQVANWVEASSPSDEPSYDTVLALSITKWIHLNHGDTGLMRFFRRAFNLLKPGGHLLLEPQPKSSYRRTRFTAVQHANYKNINIDPSNLEPLLLELGFSYFDTIKVPKPNEPFQRRIMLCSKSYGATPSSIRNDYRNEAQLWQGSRSRSPDLREPPPVNYCPQTPFYNILSNISSPGVVETQSEAIPIECLQSEVVSSTVESESRLPLDTLLLDTSVVATDVSTPTFAPDSTSTIL